MSAQSDHKRVCVCGAKEIEGASSKGPAKKKKNQGVYTGQTVDVKRDG